MLRRTPRLPLVLFLVLITAAAAARFTVLDRPFTVNSEGFAAGWVLSSARNHVRYGLASSRGAGILNSGRVDRDAWVIYAHHPPLTNWSSAAAFAIWGVSERTGRLVPAFFSIATTALLFWVAFHYYGILVAGLSGIVYAFCPMTLALGDMAEYTNAPLVFFGVAAVAAYVRWWETVRPSWLVAASGLFLLAALSDWPAFYLVPLLCGHALATRRARFRTAAVAAAGAAAVFLVLIWWISWSGGDVSVWHQFTIRTRVRITLWQWVERVILHHQGVLHTWPVLLLTAVYVVHTARLRWTGRLTTLRDHSLPLLLLAWGATNLLVAVDGNYRHEWWSMILTPGLAVGAALGAGILASLLPDSGPRPLVGWPLLAGAVALFIITSAYTAHGFTLRTWQPDEGFSLETLGRAINRVAAETEGVLTSVDTTHGSLWFYGDRQLRPGIATVEALDGALGPGPYRLFSRYEQPSGPAPSWFVMPREHRVKFPDLAASLDARYPREEGEDAVIHRISAPFAPKAPFSSR